MIAVLKVILWGIVGILLFVVLLGFVPFGVQILSNSEGVEIRFRFGIFSFCLHSSGKKKKGEKKSVKTEKEHKKNQNKNKEKTQNKEKKSKVEKNKKSNPLKKSKKMKKSKKSSSGALAEQIGLVRSFIPLILGALGGLSRKKRIHELDLELVVGDVDPVKATLLYGQAHALLGTIWIPLDEGLNLEKGRARVVLCYEEVSPVFYGKFVVTITLWQVVGIGLKLGIGSYKLISEKK